MKSDQRHQELRIRPLLFVESVRRIVSYTAVPRNVVQLKSIKAYATIPKGMMGCGCSLYMLHRQVHDGRRCFEYLLVSVKRNKMDSEHLLKFIEYFPDHLSAVSRTLLRCFGQPLSKQLYQLK